VCESGNQWVSSRMGTVNDWQRTTTLADIIATTPAAAAAAADLGVMEDILDVVLLVGWVDAVHESDVSFTAVVDMLEDVVDPFSVLTTSVVVISGIVVPAWTVVSSAAEISIICFTLHQAHVLLLTSNYRKFTANPNV